jgi:hypothetical protein
MRPTNIPELRRGMTTSDRLLRRVMLGPYNPPYRKDIAMNHQLPAISSTPTRSTLLTNSMGNSAEHDGFNAWNSAQAIARHNSPESSQADIELAATAGMIACGYRFNPATNEWTHADDVLLAALNA